MKHLSPDEQKLLLMARRHRAEYWRRLRRVKGFGRTTLLLASCAAGLLATTGPLNAAEGQSAVSASALFNEANAELRADRLGAAILGYERARWLTPMDPSITQNLSAARAKAGVTTPAVSAWERPAHWLSFDSLAALASISLLLLCFLAFGTRLIPSTMRGLARGLANTFAGTALLVASAIAVRWSELDRAVVQRPRTTAHIAPAAASGSAFELKPGELVTARRKYGDFVLVRTLDQRSGWVAKTEIERIIPPAANPSPM